MSDLSSADGRDRVIERMPRFRSISAEVSRSLRDMILTGKLLPDQRITQEELAKLLGVSTMPVREALLRLGHEGFIEASRGRSFRVSRTTREDVSDIYWAHSVIEGELTRRACLRSEEVVGELERIHRIWGEAVRDGEPAPLEELNFAFHREINRAADSPKLLILLRQTLQFIPGHFYSLLPRWAKISERGHEEILEAMRRKDHEGAAAAASRHVLEAGELLITYFDDTGFWNRPAPQTGG